MAKISVGNIVTAPGLSSSPYGRSAYVSGASPSCFEEPAFDFSGDDALRYKIGTRVSSGQMHQRFNSYQGTLRFIYMPYQDSSDTSKRILFYIEGATDDSYMTVYVENNKLYFEVCGIAAVDGTTVRQVWMSLGAVEMNKRLHIVARWDFNGMVTVDGANYYMALHTNSTAATNNCNKMFPLLSWGATNTKELSFGNDYLRTASAEGKMFGLIIEDIVWNESKIIDDYNAGSLNRLAHVVGIDTIFSGPYERKFSTSDYVCYGIDKSYICKEKTKIGEPESDYFRFQNKNGNLIQDAYMFRSDTNNWNTNNVKIGKNTDANYIKTGRHSLKIVRAGASNTYTNQSVVMDGGGPLSIDYEIYITKGSKARVTVLVGVSDVLYDSGDLTTIGWNKEHGSFAVPATSNFTVYINCESSGGGATEAIIYLDRIFLTPNHIVQPSFENFTSVAWKELSSGEAHWVSTGYSEGSSMRVYNTPVTLSDAVYQPNLIGHTEGDRFLLLGQMRENADILSCKPYFFAHQEGESINDKYIVHNFAELSGLCVDSSWHNFGFTFPAEFGNFDYIFQYSLNAVNSYFYLDNLACIALDTIAPATYFSGTDNYGTGRYATDTGALLIDGRDVLKFSVSSYFINTISGGVLIGFKPNGSWWQDDTEHVFMQYGSGDIVFKKNTSNEIELNYNDAVCTVGVSQMSPTKYQFVGASWEQEIGSLSIMAEGSYNTYIGTVTAINSANTVYFGNSNTPTGDTSVDAYFNSVNMYGLYVDTNSWERVFNHEVFS